MAFDIKTTLRNVQSHFTDSGYFTKVIIGEPEQPPQEDLCASIFMDRVETVLVFGNGGTREVHHVRLRVYTDEMQQPQENIEFKLADVVSRISSDLQGEFDLGATVVNIDIAGMHGTPYGARWGRVELSNKRYRIVDIMLPLIVDDSATAAA